MTAEESTRTCRFKEGDRRAPSIIFDEELVWEEVDSLTFGAKIDGHYVTIEPAMFEVTDVTHPSEVERNE